MTHMAMEEAAGLAGRGLVDRNGASIGSIRGPLGSPDHGQAAWIDVDVDGSGRRAVIPVVDLDLAVDPVRVPYLRQQVLEAPVPASDAIAAEDDHALRGWYGLPPIDGTTSEGRHQYEHQGLEGA